ncbi:uncharacterized protein VTP21DRAFT_8449 [Calcarisporiella thermophila]|uniref:uncharacterized protein n=1 Tax=Calcarisporiella thermophila TaxID=911321 RepID=UPI003743AFA7
MRIENVTRISTETFWYPSLMKLRATLLDEGHQSKATCDAQANLESQFPLQTKLLLRIGSRESSISDFVLDRLGSGTNLIAHTIFQNLPNSTVQVSN